MSKITIEKNLFCLPWTQTLLGTHLNGKPNFMALDWLTRVNYQPAMLGICVNRSHASHAAIRETGEFSVYIPSVEMVSVTDYCGIVSANKVDKSKLFEVIYGELKSAPLITVCPLNIECRLVQTVDLPTNTLFIGEIVTIFSEEKYLEYGKPDVKKIRPFLLTMPDNRFWAVGEQVGNAWKDGVPMPTILAIQHVEPESPAPVAAVLESCGVSVRTLRIADCEPVPREPGAHSGLLIMGGPMGVYEQARHPFLAEEIRLIKRFVDCEIPILGICLGSQLLAAALGARVQPGRSPEIGWLPVRLTKDANADALWHGVPSPLVPLHWHGDVFDLPRDAVTLASSELTPVQAFRFRSNAYGLLFHIEATRS